MQARVLLSSPAPLNTFLRLRFDVDAESDVATWQRVCSGISSACEASGLAVIAHPQLHECYGEGIHADAVQVVCHKTAAARAFKTVADGNGPQQWGLRIGGIKQHASALPLDDQRALVEVMNSVLTTTLRKAGWQRLAAGRFLKLHQGSIDRNHAFLEAEPGCWTTVLHVQASLHVEQPSHLSLYLRDAGLARFCILNPFPASMTADDQGQPVRERLRQALAVATGKSAINRHLYNKPCWVIPYMSTAYVKRVLLDTKEEGDIRRFWLATHEYQLPDQIPFFFEVSASPDEEDAVHLVPSCCVWTVSAAAVDGLVRHEASDADTSPSGIVRLVVDDVTQSAFKFFGGAPCARKAQAAGSLAKPAHGAVATGGQAGDVNGQMQMGNGWTTANEFYTEDGITTQGAQLGFSTALRATGEAAPAGAAVAHQLQPHQEEGELWQDPFDAGCEEGMNVAAQLPAVRRKQDVSREREAWQRLASALEELREEAEVEAPKVIAMSAALPTRKGFTLASAPGTGGGAGAPAAAPPAASSAPVHMANPNTKPALKRKPGAPGMTTTTARGVSVGGAAGAAGAPKKAKTAAAAAKAAAPVGTEGEPPGEAAAGATEDASKPVPAALVAKPKAAPKPRKPAAAPVAALASATLQVADPALAVPTAAERGGAPAMTSLAASGPDGVPSAIADDAGAAAAAAAAAAAENARKRTKAKDLDVDAVLLKVTEKHAAGKLKDLTIPELQCFLRARKLPVSGKKGDLEARVQAHLGGAPLAPVTTA